MSERAKAWATLSTISIIVLTVLFFACFKRVKVEAGEEAVLVKKPIFFGHGGVVKVPVRTGSVWVVRSTEAWHVPVTPNQYPEAFDDMNTKNKSLVDFNSYAKMRAGKAET